MKDQPETRRRTRVLFPVALACVAAAAVALVAGTASATSARQAKTKLLVWGLQESAGRTKVLDQLTSEFERKHDVDVEWVRKSFNDLTATVKLALSGPNSPDIAQLPQGWPMVDLVKAGLLVPLDKYSARYGWKQRFPSSLLKDASATADGKHFGTGNLYGVSLTIDFLGIYYDRQQLKKLGLRVPKTFAQLEADLAAAKRAGTTPIAFGNSDKWPLAHFSYQVLPQFTPNATIRNFVYAGGRHPSIETPGVVAAATTLRKWAQNDYFSEGYNGISVDDAWSSFLQGKSLFFFGGSWYNGALEQAGKQKAIGFFAIPPRRAGAPNATCGTGGNPYAVSTKSENADLAAQFLDYLTSRHAVSLFASVARDFPGPVYSHPPAPRGTTLADLYAALGKLQKANGLTPWLDWATPTMYDTLTASLQELLAGKTTPQAFVETAQRDEDKFLKTLAR